MNELTPPVSELDHHRGSLDAPVILVEFGDYESPDTVAVHPIVQQLLAEAGDQLCFVYRHFPLLTSTAMPSPLPRPPKPPTRKAASGKCTTLC